MQLWRSMLHIVEYIPYFLISLQTALLTWVQLSVSQLSVEVVASGDELIFHIALYRQTGYLRLTKMQREFIITMKTEVVD